MDDADGAHRKHRGSRPHRADKTRASIGGAVGTRPHRRRDFLDWLIQRARNQGREVIIADGDRRNADLAGLYPGQAMQPPSDDTGDVKEWITSVLIRMAEMGQSVALDLGGGDRVLSRIRARPGAG